MTRCPICEGRGVVAYPPNTPATQREFTTSSSGPWPCPLCSGAMVVPAAPTLAGERVTDWPEKAEDIAWLRSYSNIWRPAMVGNDAGEIVRRFDRILHALTSSGGGGTAGEAAAWMVRRPDRVGFLFGKEEAARDFANEEDTIQPLYASQSLSGARVPEDAPLADPPVEYHATVRLSMVPRLNAVLTAGSQGVGTTAPAPAAGSEALAKCRCSADGKHAPTREERGMLRACCDWCSEEIFCEGGKWVTLASPAPTAASGAEMPQVTAEDVARQRAMLLQADKSSWPSAAHYARILALCEYALAKQPPSAGPTGDDHA